MKKRCMILGFLLLTICFFAGNASAYSVGIYSRYFYSDGAIYNANGTVAEGSAWGSQDLTPGVVSTADGTADSKGVSQLASWINTQLGTYIYELSGNSEITLVISGVDDILWDPNTGATNTFDLYSVGLKIDVYLDYTPDFSITNGSGADDGVLLLSLEGHLQTATDSQGTSFDYALKETYDINSGEYSGYALLDVVAGVGLWADIYDTNSIFVANSSADEDSDYADFRFSLSLDDNTDPLTPLGYNLAGTSNGIGVGQVVPEPATLLLLGFGLLGLAGIRRKRA